MISIQVLKDTITDIKKTIDTDIALFEPKGSVVASTAENIVIDSEKIAGFAESDDDIAREEGCCLKKIINDEGQLVFVLAVLSDNENGVIISKMAANQIAMMLRLYKEHFDQENFVKNIILDNLLVVDIYSRAKKLDIDPAVKRTVFILSVDKDGDYLPLESIRELYKGEPGDFITAVDERSVIIVKQIEDDYQREDLKRIADEILEVGIKAHKGLVKVAYGNVVNEIKEVSRSYKEARMALDVGKIFFEEKDVIAFAKLGIGRIIYQLPVPLCRMFIKEIFSDKSIEDFDAATVTTINKFFENSLNVSETSRQLSIHRNTLVYRLDKLLKTTGLDLRVFDDAITFKIALMVVRYMKYKENNN